MGILNLVISHQMIKNLAVLNIGVKLDLKTDKELYHPGDYVSGEIYLVIN